MNADDPRHGTERGHEQHCRDGEEPCQPCRHAKIIAGRRRSKRKAMGHLYTVPADAARERLRAWRNGGASYGEIADHVGIEESRAWEIINSPTSVLYTRTAAAIMGADGWPVTTEGLTRRVRALCRLGWSIPHIAAACGVHHDTILDIRRRRPEFASRKVRAGIVAGYESLSMKIPTAANDREQASITRARNYAERQGWRSPMSYDDVDDPGDRAVRDVHSKHDVDPIVVERVLSGARLPMTRAERFEVVTRARTLGWSYLEIEARTGIAKPERYIVQEAS